MRICPLCHLNYHDDERRCLVDGAELQQAEDERIGTVLAGRYVLESVLGEGGMATVYRARHNLVERPCAVKILHPELSQDSNLRERLRREARSAAAISHPNVVEIYDFGETPTGEPFLVMELLDGVSLRELVGQPMPLDQVIDLGRQVAEGLARAHDLGVVHRDLKPENIFVVEGESGPTVKLVDFGLAQARRDDRLTATGEIVGTPQYMAPERFKEGGDVKPAADLYALGIVLFELVTGRLPFESNNIAGFVLAHLEETPPHVSALVLSTPLALDMLIDELLRKNPDERPVDAHQVLERLQGMRPTKRTRLRITTKGEALPRMLVTIDRWQGRVAIYEEMLERTFPQGPPTDLMECLAEMRAALGRLRVMRNRAMDAQRELEHLEGETVATRERLGHAVHVLGVDLSSARVDVRALGHKVEASQSAVREHSVDWRAADAQLGRLRTSDTGQPMHGSTVSPGEAELGAARRALGALEGWHRAQDAFALAQNRLATSHDRVRDLSFQTQSLRERLKRVEQEFDDEAKASRSRLADNGVERRKIEMRILHLASKLSAPLRERPELQSLFTQFEAV